MSNGPVLIELDEAADINPATADLIDATPVDATAMSRVVQSTARPRSRLLRWFWALSLGLIGLILSLALWEFVFGLLAANPVLGGIAAALTGGLVLILLVFAVREAATFARLRRIDRIRSEAVLAMQDNDPALAKRAALAISDLYKGRGETRWARERHLEGLRDTFDADATLALSETRLLAPLDQQAANEIATAARQVATVTAIVPLALADVAVALVANLRMIRRIAEIYGGRGGALANWRLTRSVMAHLVATGAVAVGDDLISSVAGGGLISKVSRRFGEGVINGALTARVGVAAMDVCRPLPFIATTPPRVTTLLKRALAGLFTSKDNSKS